MANLCRLQTCNLNFKDKECKCYSEPGTNNDNDQFCGFLSDDGYVYGCDSGCCGDGCPGQCPNVKPRPPQAFIPSTHTTHKDKIKVGPLDPVGRSILALLLILLTTSTFILAIKAFKDHKP